MFCSNIKKSKLILRTTNWQRPLRHVKHHGNWASNFPKSLLTNLFLSSHFCCQGLFNPPLCLQPWRGMNRSHWLVEVAPVGIRSHPDQLLWRRWGGDVGYEVFTDMLNMLIYVDICWALGKSQKMKKVDMIYVGFYPFFQGLWLLERKVLGEYTQGQHCSFHFLWSIRRQRGNPLLKGDSLL